MTCESLRQMEQIVLGTFVRFPERLISIADRVRPNLFVRRSYSVLCSCLLEMIAQGLPIEAVSLWNRLETKYGNHGLQGLSEILELIDQASPSGQINYYLNCLESNCLTRALRLAASSILADTESQHEPKDVLAQFEKTVGEAFAFSSQTFRPFAEGMKDTLDYLDLAYRGEISQGVPTGLPELDELCGGWHSNDLIFLGGRPGMGKSAFLIHTMYHAARQGKHVGLMTIEMSERDVDLRMFGTADPQLAPSALRRGQMTSEGWIRLTEVASSLSALPMSVFDKPGVTISELQRATRALHRRQPLDLLVVDYIQLIETQERNTRREREVSEISKSLKRLAKELHIPILAAASLNRQSDQRQDKRPELSDLRESGNLESDADLVLFMFREKAINPDLKEDDIAQVLVKKNRHGPVGEVHVKFNGASMSFHS